MTRGTGTRSDPIILFDNDVTAEEDSVEVAGVMSVVSFVERLEGKGMVVGEEEEDKASKGLRRRWW